MHTAEAEEQKDNGERQRHTGVVSGHDMTKYSKDRHGIRKDTRKTRDLSRSKNNVHCRKHHRDSYHVKLKQPHNHTISNGFFLVFFWRE